MVLYFTHLKIPKFFEWGNSIVNMYLSVSNCKMQNRSEAGILTQISAERKNYSTNSFEQLVTTMGRVLENYLMSYTTRS
jgi:hypothetical protein